MLMIIFYFVAARLKCPLLAKFKCLLFGFSRGARFVRMRHQIRGTYWATRQTWRNVVDFVVTNEARLARLISHRLPLHEALQSFELAKSKVSGKVMLIP
ncbi:hypothetical protein [Burkholderia cepacia]|uniref:hypothetical protein n=1 Tax=Burkholderia cepacia TaxID=292 RepID=UPI0012D98489|nr:hypothetical protein [Burkholderia cepacia]